MTDVKDFFDFFLCAWKRLMGRDLERRWMAKRDLAKQKAPRQSEGPLKENSYLADEVTVATAGSWATLLRFLL